VADHLDYVVDLHLFLLDFVDHLASFLDLVVLDCLADPYLADPASDLASDPAVLASLVGSLVATWAFGFGVVLVVLVVVVHHAAASSYPGAVPCHPYLIVHPGFVGHLGFVAYFV